MAIGLDAIVSGLTSPSMWSSVAAAAFASFFLGFPGAPAARSPALQQRLERAVREFPGTVGIAVKNLDTGEAFAINGDIRFPTASLIKVAVMVEVFHRIAA